MNTHDDPRGWTVFVYEDPYTHQELVRAMEEVFARRLGHGPLRLLVDRRGAKAPTPEFINRITYFIETHRAALSGARVAIVASDDLGFGMARMTQLKAQVTTPPVDVYVCRDEALAEVWLAGSGL